ncbi:MAG: hypothetical protein MRY83_01610, partial [Flavobacteriales bacterium]|nr:hypothetical protein [Flavobacteriales bacterium]
MPSQKELDIKIIRSCYEGNFHVLESEILAFLKEKEFTIERFERLRENIWSLRISKEFGDLLVDLDLPILVDRNLKPGKGEICLYGLTVLKGGQEISFEQLSGNQIEVLKDHLSIFIPPISQNENETLEDLFNSLYNNSQKKNPLTIRPYWQDTYKKFKIKKNFKPKLDGIDQEVREFIHDYGFPIIFSNFGVIYLMESLFKDLNNNKPVQKLFIREYIELKKIYHANKVMWLLI